jgi:hypothetical protein
MTARAIKQGAFAQNATLSIQFRKGPTPWQLFHRVDWTLLAGPVPM